MRCAVKVHEGPAMHLGEAQDVSGLNVPVYPAAGVQLLQILGNVRQSLQTCGLVFCPWPTVASHGVALC